MPAVPTVLAFALLFQQPAAELPTLAELPPDITFVAVFSPTGKMQLKFDTGDAKRDTIHKGKYKLDGVKLAYTITTGAGERSETLTVKTLTAETLVVVDPDGKVEEFRREVPKKK